jgi:hypothetical protein
MNPERPQDPTLPLARSYRTLQEKFAHALALEMMIAKALMAKATTATIHGDAGTMDQFVAEEADAEALIS